MAKSKIKSSLFKSRFLLAVFAVGFAGLGAYFIVNSKAATTYGTISFQFKTSNGTVVNSNGSITVSSNGGSSQAPSATNTSCTSNYPTNTQINTQINQALVKQGDGTYLRVCQVSTQGTTTKQYYVTGVTPPSGYSITGGATTGYVFNVCVDQINCGSSGTPYVISVAAIPPSTPPPTISGFTFNPKTITVGQSVTYSWSSSNATSCKITPAGAPGSASSSTPSAQGPWTVAATTAGAFNMDLWCYGNGSIDAGAGTLTVNPAPTPIQNPAVTSFSPVSAKVDSGQPGKLKWTSSNADYCILGSYALNGGGGWLAVPDKQPTSSSGFTTPPLTKPTEFVIACVNKNGVTTPTSLTSIGINGSTEQPKHGDPVCLTCGGTTRKTTSNTQRTQSRTGGVVSATDKQAPTVPANFKAEQFGSGEVDLSWDASTDNAGIAGYTLERSTDQKDWTMLDDAIVDTTYADSSADFNVAYTYRLSAKDTGGNFSDYAVVDITTNDFTANVTADEDSTITSDDGIVEVKFPAGALSEDAFCEINKDGVSSSPKGYKLVAGGYSISCRNVAGDLITQFDKDLEVTMHLKSYAKKYGKFLAYGVDDSSLSPIQSSFNKGTGDLTFTLSDLQTFAAFGAKKGSAWWIWLLIPLILIGLFLLIRRLRNGGGSDDYYDTTDYVGMPPSAPVGPLDTGAGYGQHTSLPDLVSQGQQPQYPPQQYPPQQQVQPQQPAPGPGPGQQQPPQYPQ